MISHCTPTGGYGPNEIVPCSITDDSVLVQMPSGKYRGVIISLHGLSVGWQTVPPIANTADVTSPPAEVAFVDYGYTLVSNLLANGWVVMSVPYPEDFSSTIGPTALWNDATDATGSHGGRYLKGHLHWADHLLRYTRQRFGQCPIIAMGGSWGGWSTLELVIANQTKFVGFVSLFPGCWLGNANKAFVDNSGTTATDFGTVDVTGLELSDTALNGLTLPGLVTYGSNDEALGWTETTLAAGSAGIDVSTLTGKTNGTNDLQVASAADITIGPRVRLVSLNGGIGWAVVNFTATSTGLLKNCTTMYGSGTTVSGQRVVQNPVNTMVANQNAAQTNNPITGLLTSDFHSLSQSTANYVSNWVATTFNSSCPEVYG